MKRLLAILVSSLLVASMLAACSSGGAGVQNTPSESTGAGTTATDDSGDDSAPATDSSGGGKIGIAMPTQSSERWINDGANLKAQLEALGYEVDLQYAEDDVQAQVSQLENMITAGAECLVIASIDADALVNVLTQAKNNNIPVIAYDRLLMNTDAVSYYASFDNEGVGVEIANYVVKALKLDEGEGPYNVEFFMGSNDDNNAHLLNAGVFKVLQEYLDNGQLVCQSGQTAFEETTILRWSQETAQQRMENLLAGYYSTGEDVDVVVTAFDGFAYGCAAALDGAGYSVGSKWPIITGQDAELMACKNILSGRQTQTIYKDTRLLAEKTVPMVQAVMEGTEPEINDTETYDNGVFVVPSYLCTPISVDAGNLESIVVGGGYYTAEELGL